MQRISIVLSAMTLLAACDIPGLGDSQGIPGVPQTTSGGGGTGGGGEGSGGGNPPSTTTAGIDTDGDTGCGDDDTAADPWGDEDGCGGGLPTQSPWDVGNGGSCWAQIDHWNASCEDEPCLDYVCHSPSPCGPVIFGQCDTGSAGGSDSGDDGEATTGGNELEVDDPAALECILEALRDHEPITFTVTDCQGLEPPTTYEVTSNGLVIVTTEEVSGSHHWREQRIDTFNYGYDFASCVGAGVDNWEKRWCVGMVDSGPCPVGPVACPAE